MLVILLLNQWVAASALASHAHFQTQTMAKPDMTECTMSQSEMAAIPTFKQKVEQATMDCCDQDCNCPLSATSNATLLNFNGADINITHSFALINYQFSSLTASLPLLQKPPQA